MPNFHQTFLYSRSHEATAARLGKLRKRKLEGAVTLSDPILTRGGGSYFTFPSKGGVKRKVRFPNSGVSLCSLAHEIKLNAEFASLEMRAQ